MKICYLALKKENYQEDLDFAKKMIQKRQSPCIISDIQIIEFSNIPLIQTLNKIRLKKIRRAASPNSVIIITTRLPAPLWIKRYPRLSDIFINGSFTEPQNYFST